MDIAILRKQRTEHAKRIRRLHGDNSGQCKWKDVKYYPAKDGLSNAISTVEKDNYLMIKVTRQAVEMWYEVRPQLYVSDQGRVMLPSGKKVWASEVTEKGYRRIQYKGKKLKVHRLVAESFVKNPEGYSFVSHKDGDKSNNKASNLIWVERPVRKR